MSISKKGEITELKTENNVVNLDSTPMYYSYESKVLFPETMAKVDWTSNGRMTRIERFSILSLEDGCVYTQDNKILEDVFLWDGGDKYFFVEPITIVANGEEYEIGAFSYIIASYKNGVEIYNYEKDEYTIIESQDNIYAVTENYTIDTTVDVLKIDEKEQLLLKNIDELSIE